MVGTLRKLAKRGRGNEFLWRYGFNFRPSLDYQFGSSPQLTDEQRRILTQLDKNGIAVTSVEQCNGELLHFDELASSVDEMLAARKEELASLRRNANDSAIGAKTFNVELLGSPIPLDRSSVYARFALQDFMFEIANAYFGMRVELRYYNVWNTFATSSEARESQLWHFDREDNYILKAFLYLDDVDDGAGPFTYAPATHRKGRLWNRQPEFFLEDDNVRRSKDQQMSKVVPEHEWVRATGKRGTLIFADTRGFHKGGEARSKDRLMYTCMYTSPASQSRRLLIEPGTREHN